MLGLVFASNSDRKKILGLKSTDPKILESQKLEALVVENLWTFYAVINVRNKYKCCQTTSTYVCVVFMLTQPKFVLV